MKKQIFAALVFFGVTFTAVAEEKTKFLKVGRDAKGVPVTVETATVTYKKGDVSVDLIGVIHIGDRGYYEKFNRSFPQYEALLYELVAPKGAIPKRNQKGLTIHNIIGFFLQLDSQMNVVDYTPKNFIHADLSPEGMAKAVKNRGHDTFTIILSLATDFLKQRNMSKIKGPTKSIDMERLRHKNQAVFLKRVMAETMEQSIDGAGLGETIGSILIDDRNKAAMKVLKDQIVAGRKKLGLFYGAAHMPDFEQRLVLMGFKKNSQTWQRAWLIKTKSNLEILLQLKNLLD